MHIKGGFTKLAENSYSKQTHLNDFILFKHASATPVQVEGKEVSYYVLVDDKHHISYSEYQNGYAEIEGEVVNLSDHKVVLVDLMKDEGYVFITTKFHCIFQRQNEQNVRNLIEQFKFDTSVDKRERLKEFADEIRMNKHPYIQERL